LRAGAGAAALVLLLGGACSRPQASPAPDAPAATAGGLLAVEPPAFDFGRVLPGRSLQKQFVLRNLGRQPLSILSVVGDCGCLVVGEYARRLPPGGSTQLTVVLNTPAQPGALQRGVVVRTAGEGASEVVLRLAAQVVAEER
jgi:hypothetical protein